MLIHVVLLLEGEEGGSFLSLRVPVCVYVDQMLSVSMKRCFSFSTGAVFDLLALFLCPRLERTLHAPNDSSSLSALSILI